jgi:hypothetical protein
LSIFCLFIVHYVYMSGFYLYILFPWFKLCCYEWFLFVYNLTQQMQIYWFSYIFQLKINPKNLDTLRIKAFRKQKIKEFRGLTEKWKSLSGTISVRTVTLCRFFILIANIYTILVHCRSIWVICVWGLETREKARLRRAFSRVSRRIHLWFSVF